MMRNDKIKMTPLTYDEDGDHDDTSADDHRVIMVLVMLALMLGSLAPGLCARQAHTQTGT